MSEMVKVVVDAMGGDNAPVEPVKAAVEAVKEKHNIQVILTGQEDVIKAELQKYQDYPKDRIRVVHASQVIETAEPPVMAIQKKKDSSIVVGLNLVKKQEADAFVSSGSTGAVLVGGQVIVGRIKGIQRPPLAPLIPTAKGVSLLIDCGANVDARPNHLVQFAQMGSIYMENVVGVRKPRVAIVNNGAEEEKGNALVKATFPLLKACKDINFIGSIEARDIPAGYADVVVCEAFVGNVILKLYEGVGATMVSMIKKGMMTSLRSKVGALMVKPALKETLKAFDASLKRLALDYLDLYLIHWPNPIQYRTTWQEATIGTWKAFEELYKAGRIRAIGVSNFMPHHIELLKEHCEILPMVNQLRLCPGVTQPEVVAYCKKNNILVEAYSPFGTGAIFKVPQMQQLAQKYGRSVGQICLRWSMQMGWLPLPKSANPDRVKENLNVFDFELEPEDVELIANLKGVCGEAPVPDEIHF